MSSKIEVTDAGPIQGTFSIEIKGPGVYEFRGRRGAGKSTCISSIDWLSGHKVDITLHDGAISGKVEGFGSIAPIGGRKRRKGSFEPDTIDAEKFSVTDILDPQGKTPEVRDATRIKALAVLSEAKAEPKLYYDLVGGQKQFDELGISETDDPVVLATRIKAAFDKQAREKTNTAEAESKHAAPLEHIPEGMDMKSECDLEKLGSARDSARDTHQQLKNDRSAGIAKEQEVATAKERLKKVKADYTGPTIKEADSSLAKSVETGKKASARVTELEKQLDQARRDLESSKKEWAACNQVFEAAKSHAAAIENLEETAIQTVDYPTQNEVEEAASAVSKATKDYEIGVRVRDLKQNHDKAKAHREAEKSATKSAQNARNKAGQVFEILAQSLKMKHLKIQSVEGNPRLFVEHPKRGKTAFDQSNGLSDGERVDYTLRELLPHLEDPGVLPIPQRVWQDLQPSDRENLHNVALKKGLFLFGAQVDDGDLRVVFYGDEEFNSSGNEVEK